ncbi:hypothetical protein FSHL1_009909 [Fusarium sambucinum]
MFKFIPVLLLAIIGSVFAHGYNNPGYSRNHPCAKWCVVNFRNLGPACKALAAIGKGPCYECGPKSTNRDKKLCNGACKDIKSDTANCGKCGKSCKKDVEKCQAGSCVPSCLAGKTQCGSSCVDTKTNPNNCGECGKICSSGECENGACVAPGCAGQTCDTFTACGPGGSCVCGSIAGGRGFCVDGDTPCSGLADCNTSADCPGGQVCAVGSCCSRNVCISADTCTNSASKTAFEKVSGDTVGRRADDT